MYYGLLGLAGKAAGSSYGTLTTAWIAATGETDLTILGALNTLETDLTTYGLTSKIKALYPMVGGTAGKHSYNFMNTAAYQLTFSGGWTHASTGALPNGTNAYANTGFVPNGNITVQNNHLSYYSRTNVNGAFDIGAQSTGAVELLLITRYVNGNAYYGSNDGSYGCNVANSTAGFVNGSINGSATQTLYKNGVNIKTSNTAGSSVPSSNLFLAAHNNGGATNYGNKECALASIGNGLSSTQAANFYTAVQTFQTTLARNI